MRWQGRQGSSNVEDRRGRTVRRVGGGLGLGSLFLIIIALLLGENPLQFLQFSEPAVVEEPAGSAPGSRPDDELAQFVSVVLKDTEDVWTKIFRDQFGADYQEPYLVLYDRQVQSACGFNTAASGPFYCPGDQKLYIDLSFYQELQNRFGAPGDFAMAYVLAHEVGHHVQNLMGITREVDNQRGRISQEQMNELSVRLELQADFFAGVWAHHAQQMKNILEEGDLEEALRAANAIGDDMIQRRSQGYVVPESFTHGTSEQRMRWFARGVETGDVAQGDTFNATEL